MLYCIRGNSVVHSTQINPLFYKKELLRISVVSNIRCDAGMGNDTDVPDYVNEEEKNVNEITQKANVRRASEIPEPAPAKPDNSHLYKPHGRDDSELSKFAHNESREPQPAERESKIQRTTSGGYSTATKTSQLPEDNGITDARSFTQKILDAPRRAKEKAEEFAYKQQSGEGKAARLSADRLYAFRSEENERNLHKGTISETMYHQRQKQYEKEREAQSVPFTTRMVGDVNNLGKDGAIRNFADTMVRGVAGERTPAEKKAGDRPVGILEKVGESYRPSPQPRFKTGKGTKSASPPKGTVVSKVKGGIGFSSGGVLFGGLSTGAGSPFSFNTPLFGGRDSMQEAPKGKAPRKSRR